MLALKSLDVSYNHLTGVGDKLIGPSLQVLHLEANNITELPESCFSSNLINLQGLNIFANRLAGLPVSLGTLPALESLYAYKNNFTRPLPASLGNISSLYVLSLSGSSIPGPIPASLGNMSNLATLDLSDNRLSGLLPASLGGLKNLVFFEVGGNALSGHIPLSFRQLKLNTFNVSSNLFTGALPQFPNAPYVSTLDISANYFTGAPFIMAGGNALCAVNSTVVQAMGNCLNSAHGCNVSKGSRTKEKCNSFCGTLTSKGQCAKHGVCLAGSSGLYCSCDHGYKRNATNMAACEKMKSS